MNRMRVGLKPFPLVIALSCAGCTMTVVPPTSPAQPTVVFIVDHGRHASLLLPADDGDTLMEYAYGDWHWFALGHDGPLDVLPTLFLPTQGALGRRAWPGFASAEAARRSISCQSVHALTVSRVSALDLRRRLDARFESNIDTRHESKLHQLSFVHDDQSYCLLTGCNMVTGQWLRELQCEVRGCALHADYVIRER